MTRGVNQRPNASKSKISQIKSGNKNVLNIDRLVGGNQTKCALLQWAIDLGAKNYKEIRKNNPVTKYFSSDSSVKRSSVLLKKKSNVIKKYTNSIINGKTIFK